MVEFALVAPVFFLLLFAIIEGGRFSSGLPGSSPPRSIPNVSRTGLP